MTLEIDFETQSACDIKKHGVYIYMAHPSTAPLFASYKLHGGPTKRWDAHEPCPADIAAHVAAGGTIKAHNAGFERLLWQMILTPRYGWPAAANEQFVCTAATAAALSLPRDLAGLGEALGLSVQKDKDGYRLIRKFSLPRKPRKGEPDGLYFNTAQEHPADWEKFKAYCDVDVETEAAADARMIPLRTECQQAYWLSERINDRGIRVDVESAHAAMRLAEKAKADLDREMTIVTAGYVTACTQVAALTAWVQAQGVDMTSAAKAELEELLEAEDLPSHVRRAIELRQEAAKTSVSKLSTFLERAGHDNRIRGAFLFRAAGTGRYSSTGAQLHNMPRPRKDFEDADLDLRTLFAAIRTGDPSWLRTLYGDSLGRPLWLLSDAVRGFLWAAPGHELLVADYSGIEGAVSAWFAGEDWKVQALFEIMADPSLPDLYRRAAAAIMNTTTDVITKKHPLRQSVGKTSELALQYQSGISGLNSMARAYKVKLASVFEPVWDAAPSDRRDRAEKRYEECLEREDATTKILSREGWLAAEVIKLGWRASNPAIAASWKTLEEAAYEAVANPGTVVPALKAKFTVKGGFLWCMLPSGRCLAYGAPRIKDVEVPWADKEQPPEKRETRSAVTVLGVNSVTKKFERYAIYGGLILENCLGDETEVLTPSGWKRILSVTRHDLLWDGEKWVRHQGVVFKGFKETIDFNGVIMTPDHKIWTNTGWVEAQQCGYQEAKDASSYTESDRPDFWQTDSSGLRGERRKEIALDRALRVRRRKDRCWLRATQGEDQQLRLSAAGDGQETEKPRDVVSTAIRYLACDGRQVQAPEPQGLRSLWRSWHHCLPGVGHIREVLGGYGTYLRPGPIARPNRQQRRIQQRQLPLDRPEDPVPQQTQQQNDRHTEGSYVDLRSVGRLRDQRDDVVLPTGCRMADGASVRSAGLYEPRGIKPVYDIINAGPLHRFTVRGGDGHSIIVSNCVQAISLDLLENGLAKAEAAGYPVIGHVHDEIITEVPHGFGDVHEFENIICELPDWAKGLPLKAEGWRGKRYRK